MANRYNLLDIYRYSHGWERIVFEELPLIQRNKICLREWHGICLSEGISSLLSPEKAGLSAETGFFLLRIPPPAFSPNFHMARFAEKAFQSRLFVAHCRLFWLFAAARNDYGISL
jgi:hypothetical protein